jgi:hypothetical protein
MAIGDDFSVAVNGDIRHVSGTTTYTVLELHRWLQDLADDPAASTSGNDLLDIVSSTPSERVTNQIINLLNGYNIDDTAAEFLYGGSITQDDGDTVYSGLRVLGAVNNSNTQLTVVQDGDFYDSPTAPFWGDQSTGGYNGNAAAGILMRILVKSRVSGFDIDYQAVRVQARHWGDTYAFFNVQLGEGEAVAAISTTPDPQNDTLQATVTAYTHVTNSGGTANAPTGGYQTIDINDGNGAQPYYSQWTFGADTSGDGLKGVYEYLKDLTGTGTSKTTDGLSGDLFLGINYQIPYDTLVGSFSEREWVVWGTHIWYDNLSGGTFTRGNYVVFSGGNAGKVIYDDGVDEVFVAVEDTSITIADNETITEYTAAGVASGVTADVDTGTGGGSPIEDNDQAGGEGWLLADDTTANLWIQLIHGSQPVNDLPLRGITSGATALQNGTATARTLPTVFLGSYTGSLIGAYGVGVDANDLAFPDTVQDLDGDTNSAPNNVTFTVFGLVSGEDRVLVGPKDPGANDFEKDQMTLNTTLSGATETSVVVGAASIPADTPTSGILRIQLDVGTYRRQPYNSYSGGNTFAITSADYTDPDDATAGNNVFLAYIDELASGATASFTTVYDSDRTLWVRVRDGGTAGDGIPIKTYEAQAVLGSGGGSITIQRNSDA